VAVLPNGTKFENAMAQFHSSNPSVATIDGGGVASGVAAGSTTIRIELAGQTAEATLIVN
ncbi:MAG: Ig-like domain-containing protein, partial [Acidobacteriota bacterium]